MFLDPQKVSWPSECLLRALNHPGLLHETGSGFHSSHYQLWDGINSMSNLPTEATLSKCKHTQIHFLEIFKKIQIFKYKTKHFSRDMFWSWSPNEHKPMSNICEGNIFQNPLMLSRSQSVIQFDRLHFCEWLKQPHEKWYPSATDETFSSCIHHELKPSAKQFTNHPKEKAYQSVFKDLKK